MRVTTRLEQSTTARHYSTLLTGNNFRHPSFEQNGLKKKKREEKEKRRKQSRREMDDGAITGLKTDES